MDRKRAPRGAAKRSPTRRRHHLRSRPRSCSPKPFAITNSAKDSMPEALCRAVLGRDAGHAGEPASVRRDRHAAAACPKRPWPISAMPPRRVPTSPLAITTWAKRSPRPFGQTPPRPPLSWALALQPGFAEAHKDLRVMLMAAWPAQGSIRAFCARVGGLFRELAENFGETFSTMLQGQSRARRRRSSRRPLRGRNGWRQMSFLMRAGLERYRRRCDAAWRVDDDAGPRPDAGTVLISIRAAFA